MSLDPDLLYGFPRNLVLAASAGTGKTHALVGVVLELLIGDRGGTARKRQPLDPSRIVATTFSRKAAAEIRGRVTHELERLSAEPATSVYSAGIQRRWFFGSDALRTRARHALEKLPAARFGTLHSFATGLVRSYAMELGLGPGFELAADADTRFHAEEAVARALEAQLVVKPEAVRALADAAGGVDQLVNTLRRILVQLEEDGRKARDLALPSDDAAALEREVHQFVGHAGDLAGTPRFEAAARDVISAWSAADETALEKAMAALSAIPATSKKHPEVEAFAMFRKSLPGGTNEEKGLRLARAYRGRLVFAEHAAVARDVLAAAESTIETSARDSASLGFGEILRAARELLLEHPDVADEAAAEIEALLVDEFQDTSRVQRDLLQLLWARPGTRERGIVPPLAAIRGTGLLVVGDRKQSIYGFRGADVGVFAELAVGLAGTAAREALGIPAGTTWEPKEPTADFCALRHNRRSVPSILSFANAFSARRFAPEQPPELFEIEYVPQTEDLLVSADHTIETSDAAPRTTWLRVASKGSASSRIEEALVIAERVKSLVKKSDGRAAWRDVAVLATTNGMLDAVSFAMAQANVPYVVAGKSFFRAREVRDLSAMLALVLDPSDRLAALTVLRGPWGGVHDETLLGLTKSGEGLSAPFEWSSPPNPELIRSEDRTSLTHLAAIVVQLSRVVARLGPGPLLREAVSSLSFEGVLVALPRGEQRVANVRKLLSIADRHHDAHGFLRWLDDASEQELAETEAATFADDDDAVRLLTIHASKGLDFPIVFVPEIATALPRGGRGAVRLTIGSRDLPNTLSVSVADASGFVLAPPSFIAAHAVSRRKERAERQRLAYVAVTRASKALYLVGGRAREGVADTGTSTLAVLEALALDPVSHGLLIEDVLVPAPLVSGAEPPVETTVAADPPLPRLPLPQWRSLPIAPTALADFAHCSRRFELIHVLGLPERPHRRQGKRKIAGTLSARSRGTIAHAVLERVSLASFAGSDVIADASRALAGEGIGVDDPEHALIVERVNQFLSGHYAQEVARKGANVRREVPFVLALEDAIGRELVLRGSIDLLVAWPDGSVDVVDYKSARGGGADAYGFQLDVYVLAARSLHPAAPCIRAGLVFLGGASAEPAWRATSDEERIRGDLANLADSVVSARWTGEFPRVELVRCEAIFCGFIGRCHSFSASVTMGTTAKESRVTTR